MIDSGLHEVQLIEQLRSSPSEACTYLQASVVDSDPKTLLVALRAVAEAYGGIGVLAARAGLNRETLYRTLSRKGNPSLSTLTAILKALGLTMTIAPAVGSEEHPSA